MKKLTLFLTALSLISATSYAKEMTVKPIENSKEVITEPVVVEEIVETPLIIETAPITTYKPLYNIYGKIGIDVWSEYDEWKYEGLKANKKDTKNLGFEIALEATRNITNNFELGLGVAYQNHAKPKSNSNKEYYADNFWHYDDYKTEMPKFDSVPLYAIAKYNFETGTAWKPYLKATLGYSFNIKDKDAKGTYDEYSHNGLEDSTPEKFDTKIKNGLYYGVGAGVEYENFFVDLMYQVNQAKAKLSYEDIDYPEDSWSLKKDFDYSRVTLGFGYKFNY